MSSEPKWLDWVRRLQAIAQNGMLYTESKFDRERYGQVRDVAAEMAAGHVDMPVDVLKGLFADQKGAATPKVDVRGVVFRDGKLLLVRETSDDRWTLPGGWADVNETPSQAVVREVYEEAGFRVRAAKVLAVYDRTRQGHAPVYPYRVYKIFFLCELIGGAATPSLETSEVRFFAEDKIPELSTRRTTVAQIRRMFEHVRNPDWPADFD